MKPRKPLYSIKKLNQKLNEEKREVINNNKPRFSTPSPGKNRKISRTPFEKQVEYKPTSEDKEVSENCTFRPNISELPLKRTNKSLKKKIESDNSFIEKSKYKPSLQLTLIVIYCKRE